MIRVLKALGAEPTPDRPGPGPVSEGLIVFIVGLVAMIGFAMWLGAKN